MKSEKKMEPDGTMQLSNHRQITWISSKLTNADHKFLLENSHKQAHYFHLNAGKSMHNEVLGQHY